MNPLSCPRNKSQSVRVIAISNKITSDAATGGCVARRVLMADADGGYIRKSRIHRIHGKPWILSSAVNLS